MLLCYPRKHNSACINPIWPNFKSELFWMLDWLLQPEGSSQLSPGAHEYSLSPSLKSLTPFQKFMTTQTNKSNVVSVFWDLVPFCHFLLFFDDISDVDFWSFHFRLPERWYFTILMKLTDLEMCVEKWYMNYIVCKSPILISSCQPYTCIECKCARSCALNAQC